MAELIFLGTGGAVGTAERDNTSLALSLGDTLVMVDCPGGAVAKMRRAGLDPLKLGSLLVTHVHPDHIYGLPSLIHSLFLDEGLITLYGSEETVRFCGALLDLFQLRASKIKMRVELKALGPGQGFELGGSARAEAFRVPHSPGSMGYHFFLDSGRREVVCSGDTPPDPEVLARASGRDYLVHDCSAPSRFFEKYPVLRTMHTSALDLGRLAEEAGVRCLIPCHFFGEVDYPMSEVEGEIRKYFSGRLVLPSDLETIRLTE